MKIAAVCCTYLRPKTLGQLIRCFLEQDYPDRELIILDDAGQYDNQQGDRWRLISIDQRFPTLGEKRNAAAALAADDVEGLAVWDDDDLYLPWALRACAAALKDAAWSRPSLVLYAQKDGSLRQHQTGGLYHGGWAYRRTTFAQVGGYPPQCNGEDRGLARRLQRAGIAAADPCARGFPPFYVYCWDCGWHLSSMGSEGYRRLGGLRGERTAPLVAPPTNIDLHHPKIMPGVFPRAF
jgi:glycosyltransferase involved in cell wall biosynthesis